MIKAIVFDMDGLLIDSEPFWEQTEYKILSKAGVPLNPQMTSQTMGFRIDEVVEYWYAKYPWKFPSKKEIELEIIKGIIDLVKSEGKPKKGAIEIIKLLKQKAIPMAIASSSYTGIIEEVVKKLGIGKDVKILCSSEHEEYGKPHPGVYITASSKLGISPSDCLVFEDSPNGVLAAKAAKMKCIAVPDKKVLGNKVFQIADLIIKSLDEFKIEYLMKIP